MGVIRSHRTNTHLGKQEEEPMGEYHLTFVASQIHEQITFRGDPSKFESGDAAWWSMPSFKNTGERTLSALEKDGGHWRGQVHILPDGSLNMLATWYPVAEGPDPIQFAGPIVMGRPCHVSIVGGTGKYAGARGEAKATMAMSDKDTPLYIYEISLIT
jgi:hypothetical protein